MRGPEAGAKEKSREEPTERLEYIVARVLSYVFWMHLDFPWGVLAAAPLSVTTGGCRLLSNTLILSIHCAPLVFSSSHHSRFQNGTTGYEPTLTLARAKQKRFELSTSRLRKNMSRQLVMKFMLQLYGPRTCPANAVKNGCSRTSSRTILDFSSSSVIETH